MAPIKVKIISKGSPEKDADTQPQHWNGCEFHYGADFRGYDWLVVYDEFPRSGNDGKRAASELLDCHPDHTVLVTVEPPSIKLYGTPYTDQFGTVLSTQPERVIRHRDHVRSGGGLLWFYGKPLDETLAQAEWNKTGVISTVCSTKQQTHTLHAKRFRLTQHLAKAVPGFDWFGRGVRPMEMKADALDPYRYHVAVENHSAPHHWTEKLADSFLGLTLPFYGGHPDVVRYFPPESFILIPVDDPPEAARIINEAIANDEYSKRLPAIREARRRILEQYNFYALVSDIIRRRHDDRGPVPGAKLLSRRALRRNPLNALRVFAENIRYRLTKPE